MATDSCLVSWAKRNLTALSIKGAYEVVTVCGRPTAALAGPAGDDSKVLVYGALQHRAPAGMKQLIAVSTAPQVAFEAVQSADGKARLRAGARVNG